MSKLHILLTNFEYFAIINSVNHRIEGVFMVDSSKCISCGACISICPVNAIKFVDGKAQINPKKCIKCGSCAQFCPVGAITIDTKTN